MNNNSRRPRRGSAVGLLNVDDEVIHGENAHKYGKKKGSFLKRVKQNVGQTIEAATKSTNKLNIPTLSKSGHYSVDKKQGDSDDLQSDEESHHSFGEDDQNAPPTKPNENSDAFDQTFNFENAFQEQPKQKLDVSQHSFFDDGNHEISDEQRKSNGNLLSRRLEDPNLTKIKYGDEASILQFSPLDGRKSEPILTTTISKETNNVDRISKSERFTTDSNHKKKKDKARTRKLGRNNSMPSEKILRRAQRRSVEAGSHGKGRAAPKTRKVRRTKSNDDVSFDMDEKIDVHALVETMKSSEKKNSRRVLASSSHHKQPRSARTLGSSSHHKQPRSARTLGSSSHHNRSTLDSTFRHKRSVHSDKRSSNTKSKSPTDITQSSNLHVRF